MRLPALPAIGSGRRRQASRWSRETISTVMFRMVAAAVVLVIGLGPDPSDATLDHFLSPFRSLLGWTSNSLNQLHHIHHQHTRPQPAQQRDQQVNGSATANDDKSAGPHHHLRQSKVSRFGLSSQQQQPAAPGGAMLVHRWSKVEGEVTSFGDGSHPKAVTNSDDQNKQRSHQTTTTTTTTNHTTRPSQVQGTPPSPPLSSPKAPKRKHKVISMFDLKIPGGENPANEDIPDNAVFKPEQPLESGDQTHALVPTEAQTIQETDAPSTDHPSTTTVPSSTSTSITSSSSTTVPSSTPVPPAPPSTEEGARDVEAAISLDDRLSGMGAASKQVVFDVNDLFQVMDD